MPRHPRRIFAAERTPRFLVLWNLQWEVVDCQTLGPDGDPRAAMNRAMAMVVTDGWRVEGTPDYGFVFLRRGEERRLLTLTPRDPCDSLRQSFSPFREQLGTGAPP